ncbi:hypothetical protein I3842_16G004200 [Carya illinoinensis]|uniref:Uncharacterized protein n=1 Tax=Carya illinoinensis TaxID=32201 RepID=A0A922A745_CARIL|nr:hypothetical protein I3842_16G004200 [Carya illinoinensis]
MERVNSCFFPNFRISDSRPPNTYPVFNPPFPPIHYCPSLNYSQISSFQIPNFIFISYLSVKNLHIYIYPLFPPQYSSLTPNYHPTEPYAADEKTHTQPTETLTSPEKMPTVSSHSSTTDVNHHRALEFLVATKFASRSPSIKNAPLR